MNVAVRGLTTETEPHRCRKHDRYGDLLPDPIRPILQIGVHTRNVDGWVQAGVDNHVVAHLHTSQRVGTTVHNKHSARCHILLLVFALGKKIPCETLEMRTVSIMMLYCCRYPDHSDVCRQGHSTSV